MEISLHFHLDSNKVITTKFCTWHDSCAVVACAQICCDLMASNGITARWSFHRIWIVSKKSLVKWAPVCNSPCLLKWGNVYLIKMKFMFFSHGGVSIKVLIINSFPPGQNGCHFRDNFFKCIFMNAKFWIAIQISLEIVPKGPIDNKSELVQVMALHWTGNKPLPEPMLTQFTDTYMQH